MCGISGIVGEKNNEKLLEHITKMGAMVSYRGPDDEGYVIFGPTGARIAVYGGDRTAPSVFRAQLPYTPRKSYQISRGCSGKVALGHRRLSVIDLSPAGHQPMSYSRGRYWIAFNGEIYNHCELRDELIAKNYRFVSNSDTEVIMAAYDCWGTDCLHKLNGMFSFLLYDTERNKMLAARDRFGIKPLYYWRSPAGFWAFASEIKQFSALPGWKAVLNGQRVYDFLMFRLLDHTDETMFDGVRQLRGGEAAVIHVENTYASMPVFRWYRLVPKDNFKGLAEASGKFREILTDAVRLRMRSDVPVGSCLSGGLDSSSVVCLMNALLSERGSAGRQKTFTGVAQVRAYDESEYARAVIQRLGVKSFSTSPTLKGLFETLDNMIWHLEEPFCSSNAYTQWCVFKLARQNGVTVMLDGQGADELMGGYEIYCRPPVIKHFCSLQWVKLLRDLKNTRRLLGTGPLRHIRSVVGRSIPHRVLVAMKQFTNIGNIDSEKLRAKHIDPRQVAGELTSSIRKLSHSQLTRTNLTKLLHWEDRSSMAHSVEARVPFLDHRLVEFVLGLPDEFKVEDGITKVVLRESMKGVLPEKVRMRSSKLGFDTGEAVWANKHPTIFSNALKNAVDISFGVIRPGIVEAFESDMRHCRPYDTFFWRAISLGRWIKVYNVSLCKPGAPGTPGKSERKGRV